VLAEPRRGTTGRALVVVQLSGGNDGLSTLVPFEDDAYHRARPTLRLPKPQVLRLSDTAGLHPRMQKLKELYDAGHLAIVEGVGYPRPSRSHFRSMEIWHTGNPSDTLDREGWIGRYLDLRAPRDGSGRGVAPAAFIGNELPLALIMARGQVTVVPNLPSFRPLPDVKAAGDRGVRIDAVREVQSARRDVSHNPTLAFLAAAARSTLEASQRVQEMARRYETPMSYPGPLGQSLRLIATLISGGAGYEVFYVTHGGFDTHANQYGAQANLLGQLAEAVAAFLGDLRRLRKDREVLIMAFSEFGRRVEENASRGTDHGTAGPMFLAGGAVKGGLYGRRPSLTDLDAGDLKFTTDFRGVYRTVLERWLGCDARRLLRGEFAALPFL
jgi:uncharacterized protein (DUF1501 family)